MKVEIEVYGALCGLSTFKINGIEADEEEFVSKYDHNPDVAAPYGCGDMRADIVPATDEVLEKYGISLVEYMAIAQQVSAKVSFGSCGWCV